MRGTTVFRSQALSTRPVMGGVTGVCAGTVDSLVAPKHAAYSWQSLNFIKRNQETRQGALS